MGVVLVLFGEIGSDSPVRFLQALVVEFGWVPLSGLSWLPYKIACGPLLLHQAPSPHPSIVDGFNDSKCFGVSTGACTILSASSSKLILPFIT